MGTAPLHHAIGGHMAKTPERVVELLKKEIPANISLNKFCKKTGINSNSVDRYMAGVTEPTQLSLRKLAEYFYVTVDYLRGGKIGPMERLLEGMKWAGIDCQNFDNSLSTDSPMVNLESLWSALFEGRFYLDYMQGRTYTETILDLAALFNINQTWVSTGRRPQIYSPCEIVGTVDEDAIVLKDMEQRTNLAGLIAEASDDDLMEAIAARLSACWDDILRERIRGLLGPPAANNK